MRVRLHRKVRADVDQIMDYYEDLAGPHLADEFYKELLAFIRAAARRPERFHIVEQDLRRANLRRFPYHFIYRVVGDYVRVLVVWACFDKTDKE